MRVRVLIAAVLAAGGLAGLAAVVVAERSHEARRLTVTLRNADGAAVGKVTMTAPSPSAPVAVRASVRRLTPGFHGFHIHAVGSCKAPTFMSAMGHLKAPDQAHADHVGDMSSLLAKRNRTATLRLTTDRFRLADLRDADGSAVMVHAAPDNFGAIPPRYAPEGPDQATRDTGDSGARVACGEIAARRR
jgi:Cu-Zn family superoxide dismutase